MTGLETGKGFRGLWKKRVRVSPLQKRAVTFLDPISVSTSQWAGEQFRTGKEGVIFVVPAGSQCAVSHLTLPEKRRIGCAGDR